MISITQSGALPADELAEAAASYLEPFATVLLHTTIVGQLPTDPIWPTRGIIDYKRI
ncbi:MAG: hypothetical protein ACYDBJ_10030 [Aggregatilineales bacterium]